MKSTVDIIGDLVNGFNPFTTIKSVVNNLDGTFTIGLCSTLNMRKGLTFTLNSVVYTITAINVSLKTVTYESLVTPVVGELVYFQKPFYFHGTPIAVGAELNTIDNSWDKLPMAYLYEIIRDSFPIEIDSSIDRISSVRMFFVDEANFSEWDTDGHYSNAITPQASYAKSFVDYIVANKDIGLLTEAYSIDYHAKFGISINQNGHIKNLFADEMSGVELNISLPIKKSSLCEC